ncbi:MAG: hypothetical protein JWO04_1475 [Gammaproteobacteria bacterium]|nr:hypothetical protein [Gammaproteobacteria bacterium]
MRLSISRTYSHRAELVLSDTVRLPRDSNPSVTDWGIQLITVPTTLVLGAGASKPYGYPLGEELVAGIAQNKFELVNNLLQLNFEGDVIEEFRRSLIESGLGSIDAYLGRVSRHGKVGKSALAHQMLHYDSGAANFSTNWLGYLWRLIVEDVNKPEDLKENKLSIVTFNYDTSVDRFFVNAIRSTFDIATQQACEYAKIIPIVHVYGSLPTEQTLQRVAPTTPSLAAIRTTADRLIVLHEGEVDSDELVEARQFLINSKIRVFLGFGYLKENATRLKVNTWIKDGTWAPFGTTLGLSSGEILRMQRLFPATHPVNPVAGDCLAGLRTWVNHMTS